MESGSQPARPSESLHNRAARVVGTAIALLTLTLPLWAIAQHSSDNLDLLMQTTYRVRDLRE